MSYVELSGKFPELWRQCQSESKTSQEMMTTQSDSLNTCLMWSKADGGFESILFHSARRSG